MNEITVFNNDEFGSVRTWVVDDEPWFVGKDIATILGYAKPENAIANHVDDEDKTSTLIQGSGSNYKRDTTADQRHQQEHQRKARCNYPINYLKFY